MNASAVSLGCMRMAGLDDSRVDAIMDTALENGINFFDHADIYGLGRAEDVFGQALSMDGSLHREDLILQSKCGIRKGFFDSSKEHILSAVDGILERLRTDYLDILLLHRPDALIEPEEVAEAVIFAMTNGKLLTGSIVNCAGGQIFN